MNNNNVTLKHSTWYIATFGENYHLKLEQLLTNPSKEYNGVCPKLLSKRPASRISLLQESMLL